MANANDTVLDEEEVRAILGDLLEEKGIPNAELKVSRGSAKGEGFLSFITRVDVLRNDLYLVIKWAPRREVLRKLTPTRLCFLREMYFYDTLVVRLHNFQKERGVLDGYPKVPKCYKTDPTDTQELIVMENIKMEGFELLNRREEMDDEHLTFLFEQYAKFHAVSFAFKDQEPDVFEELTSCMEPVCSTKNFSREFFDLFVEAADKLKSFYSPESEAKKYKTVVALKEAVMPFFKMIEDEQSQYAAILHGDSWCNNILFKYEDQLNPKKPTSLRLLDFQMTRFSTPVIDLSDFFYMSSSKIGLVDLDRYLLIYHKSLSDHLRALGSDPELFPFSALKSEWRKYGIHGLILSFLLLRSVLREDDEICDYSDVVDADLSMSATFSGESRSDGLIERRLRDLVDHLCDNEFDVFD